MYQMNEIEVWNQRRHELMREAENGRIAGRLRAERPKWVTRFRNVLLGRALDAPATLRAEGCSRA